MAIGPGFNVQNNGAQASFTGRIPAGGAKVVPYVIDLSQTNPYQVDLTLQQRQRYIDIIQACYIDASGCDTTVQVFCRETQQYIDVAGRTQGYYPLLTPVNSLRFEISAPVNTPASGFGLVTIIFMNMPIPTGQWFNNLLGTMNMVTGAIRAIPAPSSSAYTDYSTSTVAATSTQLMPSNTDRYQAIIQAPLTADVWVNPIGGTAGISASGCFRIPAGALYETPMGASFLADWNYYCATGSLVLTCLSLGDV